MFCYFSSNLVFISLINNKIIQCLLYWEVFLAILEAFILKNFRGRIPPDGPDSLGRLRLRRALKMPSAFYLAPPPPPPANRKSAARSLSFKETTRRGRCWQYNGKSISYCLRHKKIQRKIFCQTSTIVHAVLWQMWVFCC